MKLIKEKGKCFVCLKSGHISRMCQSNIKCFQCQKRHHVALCGAFDKTSSASNPTQANESPVQPNKGFQNQTSKHMLAMFPRIIVFYCKLQELKFRRQGMKLLPLM